MSIPRMLARAHELMQCDALAEAVRHARCAVVTAWKSDRLASVCVSALDLLGTLFRLQGRYRKAGVAFGIALRIAEQHLDLTDPVVRTVRNNFAVLCKYTGDFDTAEQLYRGVLCELQAVKGPDHPDVATVYHNLGGLEHARSRPERGEPHARRSVEIREKALGPDHPDVAADLAALAAILDAQKKYGESLPLYRRALRIFVQQHGPSHSEIAVNLNNLGAVWFHLGDYRKAEAAYRRALALKEQIFGCNHPDMAMTLNNLAVLKKAAGDLSEAEGLYVRCLGIFEQTLGPDHPKVAICRRNLKRLREIMGAESAGHHPAA